MNKSWCRRIRSPRLVGSLPHHQWRNKNFRNNVITNMASDFDVSKKLTEEVHKLFLNIDNAVQKRKADLLRQIEFLSQQYQMHNINIDCIEKVRILPDNEDEVLNAVKTFGKINFNDFYVDCDLFKVEDYQKPENDHVSLYKCLNGENATEDKLIVNVTKLNSSDILSKFREASVDSIDNLDAETEDLESFGGNPEAAERLNPKENCLLECIEKRDPSLCSHSLCKDASCLASAKKDQLPNRLSMDSNGQTQELCSCFSAAHLLNSSSISNSDPNVNCVCKLVIKRDSFVCDLKQIEIVEKVRKLSMEQHPIQEWMKQIIAEPETEPLQNNEMLEYKQY